MPATRRTRALPYGLLIPSLLALVVALGYPLVRQFVLSFQEFGLAQQFGRPAEWIGVDNYERLVTDSYLWKVVLRSLVFCAVNAAVTMVIGIAIALLLGKMSKPVRILVQTGLLLAWAMPVLAALTIWQWLFDSQYGVINWLLTKGGLDYTGHSWLLELDLVLPRGHRDRGVDERAVRGLHGVRRADAGVLGHPRGRRGRRRQRLAAVSLIVVPTIRPVLLVVGLLQIIWDLRVFTQIYVLQKAGGVTRDTNLLGTYIYRLGIGEGSFGQAAAVAIFMLVLTVIITYPYVRGMMRQEAP